MIKKTSWFDRIFSRGLQLLFVGCVTGLFVGVIVTFFNVAATFIEHCSVSIYDAVRETPAFIPLLFVCLVGIAFVIGGSAVIAGRINGNVFL